MHGEPQHSTTWSLWTSEAMAAPTPPLHAQVLALRRTHSARAVAQALSIPLRSARRPSSAGRRFGKRCIPWRQVEKLFPPVYPMAAPQALSMNRALPPQLPPLLA